MKRLLYCLVAAQFAFAPIRSQALAEPRWTFCVASAMGTKDVWITELLAAQVDRSRLELELKGLLERQGHPRIIAQCPQPSSDKVEVVNAQTTAEEFNRKMGSILHPVPPNDFPPR